MGKLLGLTLGLLRLFLSFGVKLPMRDGDRQLTSKSFDRNALIISPFVWGCFERN
jgi:hypothetical protein